MAGSAAAQAITDGAAVKGQDGVDTLDEIVVSARNRKEKAQEVPVPVSVLSSKDLERDNSSTFTDFARKLPGVSLVQNQPRQSSAAIRGIGKNDAGEATEGSVGVIVDGVYTVHPGSSWGNFIDLDRVEVARGPQGTLLGKNTTLGVINVTTKAPSFVKGGSYELGWGERNTIRGQGSVTGPLSEGVLAYRATLGYEKGDGPIKNLFREGETLNDLNRLNGRLQFLATPNESLTARIIVDYARSSEFNGAWPTNVADPQTYTNGISRNTASSPTYTTRANRLAGKYTTIWNSRDSYSADNNSPLINESKGWSTQLDWSFGGGYNLSSITAQRKYLFKPHNDYDPLDGSGSEKFYGGQVNTEQRSQEFRLTSPVGKAIDYQAGVYYLQVRTKNSNTPGAAYGTDSGAFLAKTTQYNTLNTNAVGRSLLEASLNGLQNYTLQTPEVDSLGVYGQLNWHLTEKATLTLGVRDTDEHRSNSTEGSSNANSLIALNGVNFATASPLQLNAANAIRTSTAKGWDYGTDSLSNNSVSWLINPSYKLNEDVLLYASTSYGEKSGAVQFISNTNTPSQVDPEKAIDFELGFKSTLLDRKLRLNVNLFQTNIKDYQIKVRVPDSSAAGYATIFGNADKVTTKGVEFDVAYTPANHWNLSASGAYNPARFASWKNGVCAAEVDTSATTGTPVCDNTGKRLGGASDVTLSLGVDYRAPLFNGYGWHTFLNNTYRSEYNASPTLSSYGKQAAFSLTDVGIGFGPQNGDYDISLVGKNIFDKSYLVSVSDVTSTAPFRSASGQGRFIGITFRAKL